MCPCSEWGSSLEAMRADLVQFGTVERAFIVHNAEGQSKASRVSVDAGSARLPAAFVLGVLGCTVSKHTITAV